MIFLETNEFQLNLFAGLGRTRQEALLRQILIEIKIIESMFHDMVHAWKNGSAEKLASIIPDLRNDLKSLAKEHGDKVISEVTIAQAFGGMRGVKGLVCDTSFVDPEKGLIIRGTPIIELTEKLPEEIYYLLCTGELPDEDSLKSL